MLKKSWIFLTTVEASQNRNVAKLIIWVAVLIFGIHYISRIFF
jgi:hypothetical protein